MGGILHSSEHTRRLRKLLAILGGRIRAPSWKYTPRISGPEPASLTTNHVSGNSGSPFRTRAPCKRGIWQGTRTLLQQPAVFAMLGAVRINKHSSRLSPRRRFPMSKDERTSRQQETTYLHRPNIASKAKSSAPTRAQTR